ncbi:transmembrane-type terpene cyclase [Methylotetracoccus oryzae]|uniref:transmembrane-type terpene cyclase n=1 Tax=Methylotetracoccus oryzae TaxID=1919059 RepID=UPI001117E036|nr:hypothetical protein [Methylotetracoccus oryzae]
MNPQETLIFQISGTTTLLLWGMAYLLIIRRAFKDRSYGMPFAPMCVNVAYEFTFGFVFPDVPPMNYANIAWFFIDLVIVYQYLRFGRDEFPALFPRNWFLPSVVLGIVTAFVGVVAMTVEFHDVNGNYSGWGDQLLISISYVALLARRQSIRGQSVYILLSRMFGSIALIPAQYLQAPDSVLLVFIYVAFIVFDLIYLTLLLRQCRLEGINPWRRV